MQWWSCPQTATWNKRTRVNEWDHVLAASLSVRWRQRVETLYPAETERRYLPCSESCSSASSWWEHYVRGSCSSWQLAEVKDRTLWSNLAGSGTGQWRESGLSGCQNASARVQGIVLLLSLDKALHNAPLWWSLERDTHAVCSNSTFWRACRLTASTVPTEDTDWWSSVATVGDRGTHSPAHKTCSVH